MPYEFGVHEQVTDAVRRSGREQLDKALRDLRDGVHSDPVGSVHSARKAIKKERALLRLSRPAIVSPQRKAENETLRGAARRLSGLRDAEVMLLALDKLAERFPGELPDAVLGAVRDRLERGRATEHERAAQSEAVAEAIHALDGVERRINQWTFRQDGWSAIEGGLKRTYRQGRTAMRKAERQPSIENLHEWRKRVKDLWYDARLLAAVCGRVMAGYAEETEELSELLGADHDLALLGQTVSAMSRELEIDSEPVLELIDHRRTELQAEAKLLGRRVYAESPRDFVRRTRRYWKAGRKAQPINSRRPNTRSNASSSP